MAKPERVQAAEKTYTIAMDTTFPPFEFADKNNKRVGIDIDLIRAIAKAEGFKVQLKATSFNGAVQELQANQVDGVMAGMSITPERKKVFAFSDPYYQSGVVMAVARRVTSPSCHSCVASGSRLKPGPPRRTTPTVAKRSTGSRR